MGQGNRGGPHKYTAKDGTTSWWQRVRVRDPESGQAAQVRVTRRTRRELELAVAELRTRGPGRASRARVWTVGELLLDWLANEVQPTCRTTTHEVYARIIRLYLLPDLGDLPADRLTPDALDAFYTRKRTQGTGTHALGQCHLRLHRAFARAVRLGRLTSNVADIVKPPPHRPRTFPTWSVEQSRAFLAVAAAGSRYGPIWAVIDGCGLRKSEALGLRWCDLDLTRGTLAVVRPMVRRASGKMEPQDPKSPSSGRRLRLPQSLIPVLQAHRALQDAYRGLAGEAWRNHGLVFTTSLGTPINSSNLRREYTRLCQAAGLTPIRIHDHRHSYVTQARAKGVPLEAIAKLVGHRDSSITARIYAHSSPELEEAGVAVMEEALFAPQETPPGNDRAHGVQLSVAAADVAGPLPEVSSPADRA